MQLRLYAFIAKIWKEEVIPEDWRKSGLVVIYKKGDQGVPKLQRHISPLNHQESRCLVYPHHNMEGSRQQAEREPSWVQGKTRLHRPNFLTKDTHGEVP